MLLKYLGSKVLALKLYILLNTTLEIFAHLKLTEKKKKSKRIPVFLIYYLFHFLFQANMGFS